MTGRFVASEVGRLRTVVLHRPGGELARLTPRNNDELLFDGIPWVERAQEEHDAFAQALRDRGVEVLHLDRLLVEVLDDGTGGAAVSPGGGLAGLQDRVSALGGTLAVDSPPGSGTRIVASIPGPGS